MTDTLLSGRRVLIVEDQYLIADEMRRAVAALGGEVVGPCPSAADAMAQLENGPVEFALLDLNLGDEQVGRVADELAAKGVPFAFATGYEAWVIPPEHQNRLRIEKPVTREALKAALKQALS